MISNHLLEIPRKSIYDLSTSQWTKWIHSITHHPDNGYFSQLGRPFLVSSFHPLREKMATTPFERGLHLSFQRSFTSFQTGQQLERDAISLGNHAELVLHLDVASAELLDLCKQVQSTMFIWLPEEVRIIPPLEKSLAIVPGKHLNMLTCLLMCGRAAEQLTERLWSSAELEPHLIEINEFAM